MTTTMTFTLNTESFQSVVSQAAKYVSDYESTETPIRKRSEESDLPRAFTVGNITFIEDK